MRLRIRSGLVVMVVLLSSAGLSHAEGWNNPFGGVSESLKKASEKLTGKKQEKPEQEEENKAKQDSKTQPREEAAAQQSPDQDKTVDRKQMTLEVQTMLNRLGFNTGKPDGVAGKRTRDAICHYQASLEQELNPLISSRLHQQLQQTRNNVPVKEYTGILQHQCEVAHINNIQNIEAVQAHGYEGVLTPDDLTCKQVVAPFKLESNLKILTTTITSNLGGLFSGGGKELKLDRLREKAKKANWLPLDAEVMYGETIHEKKMEKNIRILDRNNKRSYVRKLYAEGDAALARVLASIDEEYPYEFKLFIVDDRSVNAEAIPGGYLYVNAGVFKTDYVELVMAHEVAHVLRRHTTKELQARLVDSVETADDLKKLVSASREGDVILEKVLLLKKAIVQYSKQQELQSDACAVRIAMQAQNPELFEQITDYISDIEKDHVGLSKEASSHPAYPERKERMMEVFEETNKG